MTLPGHHRDARKAAAVQVDLGHRPQRTVELRPIPPGASPQLPGHGAYLVAPAGKKDRAGDDL